MSLVGVGIDLVDVTRFSAALTRTPELRERLFTDAEQDGASIESLAARFAAKEAVAKALDTDGTLAWRDAEVVTTPSGRPELVLHGAAADRARQLGARTWRISLSHDGGMATAIALAES